MDNKKAFIIADINLFNEQQMRKCGYSSFEQMNNDIVQKWNRVVSPNDTVILMGNTGAGTLEQMKGMMSRLNGKKVITSKHMNDVFSKKEWREIGISYFWGVSMFNKLDSGDEVLYLIKPMMDISYYNIYKLLVVDSENPIEGELPIKNKMLSADAVRWGYSPLNTDELVDIYNNMKTFAEMESSEHRSDIKEDGTDD